MNNHGLKAYDKYSVKYDRSARQIKNEDGTPVFDELISSRVTLTPEDAKSLNNKWEQFGYYYTLSDEKKTVVKKEEHSESNDDSIDGELLKKDLTLEKLKDFSPGEVDAVFSVMSKAAILAIVEIDVPKNKIGLMKVADVIKEAKARLTDLKKV